MNYEGFVVKMDNGYEMVKNRWANLHFEVHACDGCDFIINILGIEKGVIEEMSVWPLRTLNCKNCVLKSCLNEAKKYPIFFIPLINEKRLS